MNDRVSLLFSGGADSTLAAAKLAAAYAAVDLAIIVADPNPARAGLLQPIFKELEARRTPHADVEDLKRPILQQLLAHPALSREFSESIAEEHLEGAQVVDQEIVEVWRVACAPEPAAGAVLTHGALLEALQASEHVDDYRALATQEMELDTDIDTARQVLDEAFHKLRLRRLAEARRQRLADFESDPSPDRLSAYRDADQAYTKARGRDQQASAV